MFFLATADAEGQPDMSYKDGMPGFVRVLDVHTLAFPDYDGNGMFKSLGNILVGPKVGLLFVDFEHPNRMRVSGRAKVSNDDPLLAAFPGAQSIVRVSAKQIFPTCPRYIGLLGTSARKPPLASGGPQVLDETPGAPRARRISLVDLRVIMPAPIGRDCFSQVRAP